MNKAIKTKDYSTQMNTRGHHAFKSIVSPDAKLRRGKGWPPERRKAQAARIRQTKPWLKSTGPKTPEGKKRCSKNALKHCKRSKAFRNLMRALAAQRKWLKEFDAKIKAHKLLKTTNKHKSIPIKQKYCLSRASEKINIRNGVTNLKPSLREVRTTKHIFVFLVVKNTARFHNSNNRYKLISMSDSGFSGLPPGPRTGDTSLPQSIIELKAKVIELRGELKVRKVREKLEGEIVRHNPDGTTRIRTDKGEITVELRGRDIPPEGTKVEIEIPRGDPPRQVIVRPAPTQQHERLPPLAPRTRGEGSVAEGGERPPASTQPPRLDVRTAEELARRIEATPPEQRPQITVRRDDIIRLLPLPPTQLQDVIKPRPEILPAQATRLPSLPQIIIDSALFENISPLLSLQFIDHAQLSLNLPEPLPLFTQNTAEPVTQSVLERLPEPVRTPVQQLVRLILQAGQPNESNEVSPPFRIAPSSVLIMPASQTATETTQPVNIAALKFRPLPLNIPAPAGTSGITIPLLPSGTIKTDTGIKNFFDARIQTILPPSIKIIAPKQQQTSQIVKTITPHHGLSLPSLQAGSQTGEIIGVTGQNLPVLSFFLPGINAPQNFVMQFQTNNLPAGTQVQLTPLPGHSPAAQSTALAPFIPFDFFSSFQWPAMQELNQTLQQMAPQTAQILANTSSNAAAPARMPVAALFFIAAIRSGDISGWLGDKTIDTLRRIGKGDLLSRLTRDVSGLQRTAAEPTSQDWRALALPMMWEGDMSKIMLYYRRDDNSDKDDEDGKKGTRFIFDLNLDRMGEVQLDGLHRPGRLDLIVRTKKSLSQPMQQHMRRTYIEALGEADIKGELSFQNKPEQFVKVEMPKEMVNISG